MSGMTVCSHKRSLALLFVFASIAVAQMGGGMGNGSMHGQGNGPGSGMGSGDMSGGMGAGGMGLGGGTEMGGGMGMGSGMMNDLAVGPDRTAYILRRTGTPQPGGMMQSGNNSWKTELVALDLRNGAEKWKIEVDAEMVSEPVFGKDGRIFVTAADVRGQGTQGGGMMTPGTSGVTRKAQLLVIVPAATSASVMAKTDVDSDVLSAPRVAPDDAGGYVVYATGFEMSGMGRNEDDRDSAASGQRDLYAFTPDGRVKFKVKIGQAQFNQPAR